MADELFDNLTRFYREFIQPEFDDIRAKMVTKDELHSYMDDIYTRFGRLETEYHSVSAALLRLEQQMTQLNVDRVAVRSDLVELKGQVSQLTQRIADLEKDLN